MPDPNEKEWRQHILKMLDRNHQETRHEIAGLRTDIAKLQDTAGKLQETVAGLKVKAGLWALAGAAPGVLLKLIKFGP